MALQLLISVKNNHSFCCVNHMEPERCISKLGVPVFFSECTFKRVLNQSEDGLLCKFQIQIFKWPILNGNNGNRNIKGCNGIVIYGAVGKICI